MPEPDLDAENVVDMKACSKCGQVKLLTEFYGDKRASDGKCAQCKVCRNAAIQSYQKQNPEKKRQRVARYRERNLEAIREKGRRRARTEDREKKHARLRRWRLKYPERDRAHWTLGRAVAAGKLVKPDACSRCGGVGKVQAHHHDYAKPLEVEWLCKLCHVAADVERRTGSEKG